MEKGIYPLEIKSILWLKWYQWMVGPGMGVEVGETSQNEVHTLPNLNQTNFGQFFVTDAEFWQEFA